MVILCIFLKIYKIQFMNRQKFSAFTLAAMLKTQWPVVTLLFIYCVYSAVEAEPGDTGQHHEDLSDVNTIPVGQQESCTPAAACHWGHVEAFCQQEGLIPSQYCILEGLKTEQLSSWQQLIF